MFPVPTAVESSESLRGISKRVLVIDDEPLIRWALSVGLNAAGFNAVAAASATEARRIAQMSPAPDVVLLDLHQDDCSRLLSDLTAALPACHILVLGTCCDERRGPRWQGLEIIPKPFDLADVIERVQHALVA
jgi:DNA-binding response OmpR family regulator